MAVYTDITDAELDAFLEGYDLGRALSFKGIAEGVENSNFSLRTTGGDYILTLYEKRVDPAELPWFLGLMEHLAGRGIVCPQPVRARLRRAAVSARSATARWNPAAAAAAGTPAARAATSPAMTGPAS